MICAAFVNLADTVERLKAQRRTLLDNYGVGAPEDLRPRDYWEYVNEVDVLIDLAALDKAIFCVQREIERREFERERLIAKMNGVHFYPADEQAGS